MDRSYQTAVVDVPAHGCKTLCEQIGQQRKRAYPILSHFILIQIHGYLLVLQSEATEV